MLIKIELKHLAAYLPHKTKVLTKKFRFELGIENIFNVFYKGNYGNYKLILRPLSDISKIIEHNGERFNPFDVLAKRAAEYIPEKNLKKKAISELLGNYSQVEKLLEWHFDIFGLIDADLAIDINTI